MANTTMHGWALIGLFIVLTFAMAKPFGAWLFALYEGRPPKYLCVPVASRAGSVPGRGRGSGERTALARLLRAYAAVQRGWDRHDLRDGAASILSAS